jgi:hypothetical protein
MGGGLRYRENKIVPMGLDPADERGQDAQMEILLS